MIALWLALLATPLVVALFFVGVVKRRARPIRVEHFELPAPTNAFQVFGGSVPLWSSPTVTHVITAYPSTSGYAATSLFISGGELVSAKDLYLTEDETP